MYEDKTLICKECGQEFVFSAGEAGILRRARFPERAPALQGMPRRSQECSSWSPVSSSPQVCAACGGEAKVPFEPKSDRPVYCSECFAKMKEQA